MAETIDEALNDCESRMKKAIEAAGNELAGVRTGRASSALVDRLQVESYGQLGIALPSVRFVKRSKRATLA
jgi:ribosome recycling factor